MPRRKKLPKSNVIPMNRLFTILTLALLTVSTAHGEGLDSLTICMQQGDSCMQQYNTFEALQYYQQAYDLAQSQDITRFSMDEDFSLSKPYVPKDKVPRHVRLKLADCHYQRANYRQTTELLKNMPEDSLTHDAFRELALGYQKQGDTDSYIYWASQLLGRFPMDAEIVAGLILAFAKNDQPQNGIICGLKYTLKDSTNILVNRALADAWFMNRDFTAAAKLYDKLLQQGDSVFNTLYSAGMSYTQIDSLERAYKCLLPAFALSQMQHAGCAYRLGVVCVDTKRYEEGLRYLDLATQLMQPDTTIMKAITLSRGEGYYLTEHYAEAIAAWKEHLTYNPKSIATYYNIGNTYALLLEDKKQARPYLQQFLELARKEENPTTALQEMMQKAEAMLSVP
jgi:tetratricopeptide (TPR) repeat protein